VISVLI